MTDQFLDHVARQLHDISETQSHAIRTAGERIAKSMMAGGRLFVFGSGHAILPALDVFTRGGGLVPVVPIIAPGLMLWDWPHGRATLMEKHLHGYGRMLVESAAMTDKDTLVVISTAGSIAVAVEMTEVAQEHGIWVVGITSIEWARKQTSTHPSGKRLFEVADLVIDDRGTENYGAVRRFEGLEQGVGPTSTICESFIMNAIVLEIVKTYLDQGKTPPIVISAHMEGAAEHNAAVFGEYRDRLPWKW